MNALNVVAFYCLCHCTVYQWGPSQTEKAVTWGVRSDTDNKSKKGHKK